jgi:glutamyl-tRNA synthetase
VLIREDGAYLYTLPSVVDDIDFAITHIVRGEDHVTNTGVQIEVFEALGGKVPGFGHFPLLVGADGAGLSKRLGSLSVMELREGGFEPIAICSHLAKLGTSDPVEIRDSLQTLAGEFSFDKIGRAPARYDVEELKRLNAAALHAMPYEAAKPRLAAYDADMGTAFWEAVRANLGLFGDVAQWASIVCGPVTPDIKDAAFAEAAAALVPDGPLDGSSWKAFTEAVKAKTGAKGKALYMPLRQALTGLDHGPDMTVLFQLIGSEKVKARLLGRIA